MTEIFSPSSSAHQSHQERGESGDDVPAGHGLQEGAAGDQATGTQSQTGLSSAGGRKMTMFLRLTGNKCGNVNV